VKISVALATYNGSHYIKEQLDSILYQTYPVDEIVIRDDCSEDNTAEILAEYKILHSDKFKIIPTQNQRLGVARNFEAVLGKCSGDIIFLCDQDDIWESNKIEVMTQQHLLRKADIVTSAFTLINSNGRRIGKKVFPSNFNVDDLHRELIKYNLFPGCTISFSKRVLLSVLPISPRAYIHDWWILLASINKGFNVFFVNTPLTKYRIHDNNTIGMNLGLCKTTTKTQKIDFLKQMIELYKDIEKNSPNTNYKHELLAAKNVVKKRLLAMETTNIVQKFARVLELFRYLGFYRSIRNYFGDVVDVFKRSVNE